MLKIILFILFYSFQVDAHTLQPGGIFITSGLHTYRSFCRYCPEQDLLKWNVSGGIVAEADFDTAALEVSIFHLDKYYLTRDSEAVRIDKNHRILVSTGYRKWLSDWISVGVLFANSYSAGQTKNIEMIGKTSEHLETKAGNSGIPGLEFSISVDLFQFERYSVVLDSKYALMNWTFNSKDQFDHISFFLGLTYLIPKEKISS